MTAAPWGDNIDWGDDDGDHRHQKYKSDVSSLRKLSKSDTAAPRQVIPSKSQGRSGKHSSWFDWFESEELEQYSHSAASSWSTSNPRQVSKPIKRTSASEEEAPLNEKKPAVLIQSLLSLVPLEDESMSSKQYKKNVRRRTVDTIGNDEARLKALRERAKVSTEDLSKIVKKGSKNSHVRKNGSPNKLQVPFPSRPRRRSAW